MTRRRRDLIWLLGCILDFEFQPETAEGKRIRLQAKRGEVGSQKNPCPLCKGRKEIRHRGFPVPCSWCLDPKTGEPRGWVEHDVYTGRQAGSEQTAKPVRVITVHCDAGCDKGTITGGPWRGENNRCLRCEGSGRLEITEEQSRAKWSQPLAVAPDYGGGDPVDCSIDNRETMQAQRQRAGSFDEAIAAMMELNEAWPALCRVVWRVYVSKEIQPDERLEKIAGWGLEFIEARMPAKIRVPGEEARKRKQEAAA